MKQFFLKLTVTLLFFVPSFVFSAEVNSNEEQFIEAVVNENRELMIKFLESGVDSETLLGAVKWSDFYNPELAQILIKYGAKPLSEIQRLHNLIYHFKDSDHIPVHYLQPSPIDFTLPINERGDKILHVAVRKNKIKAVKALLEANVDPNIENNDNHTPFAFCKSAAVAKLLLQHKANLFCGTRLGSNLFISLFQLKRMAIAQKCERVNNDLFKFYALNGLGMLID